MEAFPVSCVRLASPAINIHPSNWKNRGALLARPVAVLAIYLLVTGVYTWPLLRYAGTRLPSDPADPVFNASILWWNATTVPFSSEWWNAPHYYPSADVAAFTENLIGLSPIATPVYWLTHNPVAAYNVAYFLTYPLSALAVYLLVQSLTKRRDAAFLAGFAFGFSPYRTTEIAHIQSLSAYWLPMALVGLHRFLQDRRGKWLALFAVCWPLQALSNGYFMLYGAVVITCWLLYFCTTRDGWRPGAAILGVWTISTLPLAPIFAKYSAVHEHFGFIRNINEILAYSATARSWTQVSGDVWFWRALLPQGTDDLFPGVTAVLIVCAAAITLIARTARPSASVAVRFARIILSLALTLATLALFTTLAVGPWTTTIIGIVVRMRDLNRALIAGAVCVVSLIALSPRARASLTRRDPFVFYVAMTAVIALLCCGPVVRAGEAVILDPAPYKWLMALPGFQELRVPPRFWMFGVMCLAIAAGLGYATIRPERRARATLAFSAILAGLIADGWMPTMRMAVPPQLWAEVEPAGRPEPILELPIGPDWDWDATFRAVGHRRRVMNGVSGYDPPHYEALRTGLEHRDAAMLTALASLGSYDVVIRDAADVDGGLRRYVANAPGATKVTAAGGQTLYRIPKTTPEPTLGQSMAIAKAETARFSDLFAHRDDRDATDIHDGHLDTGWTDYPQQPGQWLIVDLGEVREVGGITHALGRYFLDFPRQLAIELSVDQKDWTRVWEGPTASQAFLALVRGPLEGAMRFSFSPQQARFVRLLQLDRNQRAWHVSDVQVHAPAS